MISKVLAIAIAIVGISALSVVATQEAKAFWGGGYYTEAPGFCYHAGYYYPHCTDTVQQPSYTPVWWGGGCHHYYNPCWGGCGGGWNQGWSGYPQQQQANNNVIVINNNPVQQAAQGICNIIGGCGGADGGGNGY